LTEPEVAQIRALYRAGGVSHRQLARRFGVSRKTISHIINGLYWKHVAPAA
jgi:DNA-binding XRE family transcriptional regulator